MEPEVIINKQVEINMMDLPVEMIDKILSYLSFDQIAKARAVNSLFNNICSAKLNKGFIQVEQFHHRCLKDVKSKLPRRESERKHHPLARHSDILMAVETRLSMLSMTFTKYIELCYCCFIPGKVLDEAFKVLRTVSRCSATSTNAQYPILPRPHDFLQEYRDISSMAMEHFDDKILPSIKEKMRQENAGLCGAKNRPGRLLAIHSFRMPTARNAQVPLIGYSRMLPVCTTDLAESSSDNNGKKKSTLEQKCNQCKSTHHTKVKCSNMHKAIFTLSKNFKFISTKIKSQNILLKRKLNQHKSMIKHLRKELRDTRNAMSVMSKDLNRLKIEQSSSQDDNSPQKAKCSNLAIALMSSVTIPAVEDPPSRGIKRKRELTAAVANKR